LLGLCEEEQEERALPIGSAAPRDPHELRLHKGLGVVQKGARDGGEWRGGFYATDNAEHEKAVTLQPLDLPSHQNHSTKPPELQ